MNDKVQELLRKRVIVENKWPGCPFEVGDILIKDGNYYWVRNTTGWQQKIDKNDIEPFPYLMRPLQWWEERSHEEMPEYVKTTSGEVLKVEEWLIEKDYHEPICLLEKKFDGAKYWYPSTYNFQPARSSEYLTYQKQSSE